MNEILKNCHEVKTKFGKNNEITELRMVFKVAAAPGEDFQQKVEHLIAEFLAAAKEQPK